MAIPKVGDLAIARFDGIDGNKYEDHICIVTGQYREPENGRRYFEFIYWRHNLRCVEVFTREMQATRLFRVKPKEHWNGNISELDIYNVDKCDT